MIAKAIGPQNTVGAIGIMPRTVETAVSMMGRNRELLASIAACTNILALSPFGFDLTNQNHGVLRNHAKQRQNTENGDEAERPAGQKQRGNHTDQSQGRDAQHQEEALKALKLDHEDGDHDQQHQGHDSHDGRLRFLALFDRTTCGDAIGAG